MIEYDNPPPDVAERYLSAAQSSSLRCDTREDAPIGSIGVVIAAGWSMSRIGALLMRIHSKASRNELEQAHEQIALQAARWGMERPEAVAASVLAWWLSHVCGKCNGVRFELIAGTPALSSRHCKVCKGSGEVVIPYGSAGKRVATWLDDCKEANVDSLKARLRNTRK